MIPIDYTTIPAEYMFGGFFLGIAIVALGFAAWGKGMKRR